MANHPFAAVSSFYARMQLLLSSHLSHRNSLIRPSVCLSLRLPVQPSHGWFEIGPVLDLDATLLSFIQIDNLVFVY